ncbi:MAG: TldD/PmbA family protein [Desulfarculaceae bacterium]|nr:TldD/PmbA family protein [Desulfarculaceae bacterium]
MELERQMELARAALDKSKADAWEIAAVHSQSVSIGVRGAEVDKFQESTSSGLALRVIAEGRPGFAYVIGGDPAGIERAADEALASAAASDPEPGFSLAAPVADPPQVEVFDPELAAEPVEDKVAKAKELAAAALAADSRVVHVQPAEYGSAVSTVRLWSSEGLDFTHQGTNVSAGALAMAAENGEQEMGWDSHSARFLSEIDCQALGAEAGRRAAAFLGARPVPDGRYDVILDNEVAVQFLGLLAASLQGDSLLKGRSLLAGRESQEIISPLVSIIDDGLYPRGLGSGSLDDEGTPMAKKVLVERGVLRGFIYDRLWGARAGQQSTGNGMRGSLKGPPGVGFSNLYIEPGELSQTGLEAEMGRGLVICEIMGGHTADPVSGEFSFGASGFLVENGARVRPVKSIAIAGQALELFGSVAAVGSDLKFSGREGSPSLLLKGLSVSGA